MMKSKKRRDELLRELESRSEELSSAKEFLEDAVERLGTQEGHSDLVRELLDEFDLVMAKTKTLLTETEEFLEYSIEPSAGVNDQLLMGIERLELTVFESPRDRVLGFAEELAQLQVDTFGDEFLTVLRDDAHSELVKTLEGEVAEFPGPSDGPWLGWWFAMDALSRRDVQDILKKFLRLRMFLERLPEPMIAIQGTAADQSREIPEPSIDEQEAIDDQEAEDVNTHTEVEIEILDPPTTPKSAASRSPEDILAEVSELYGDLHHLPFSGSSTPKPVDIITGVNGGHKRPMMDFPEDKKIPQLVIGPVQVELEKGECIDVDRANQLRASRESEKQTKEVANPKILRADLSERIGDTVKPLTFDWAPESYELTHWLDVHGNVVPAPWQSVAFRDRLVEKQSEWTKLGRLPLVLLAAQAMKSLPDWNETDSIPVTLLDRLTSVSKGVFDGWKEFCAAAANKRFSTSTRDQLEFFLAVILDNNRIWNGTMIRTACEESGVSASMQEFLQHWHHWNSQHKSPLSFTRANFEPGDSVNTLQHTTEELIVALKESWRTLHSAAGGKILHTHCREEWANAMRRLQPIIEAASDPKQSLDECRVQLNRLQKDLPKIFRKSGYNDRRTMERNFELLTRRINEVLDSRADGPEPAEGKVPREVSEPITARQKWSDAWLLDLLSNALTDQYVVTDLAVERFRTAPGALAYWPYESAEVFDVRALSDIASLHAVSHFLEELDTMLDLPEWCVENRPELLTRLDSSGAEQMNIANSRVEELASKHAELVSKLKKDRIQLQALADPTVGKLDEVLVTANEPNNTILEHQQMLRLDWLTNLHAVLIDRIEDNARIVRQLAVEQLNMTAEMVDSLVKNHQFDQLFRLIESGGSERELMMRACQYRKGLDVIQDPLDFADKLSSTLKFSGKELLKEWKAVSNSARRAPDVKNKSLRRIFTEHVFQLTSQKRKSKEKERAIELWFDTNDLQHWLVDAQPNPNFLPQLAQYGEFCVRSNGTVYRAPDWIQSTLAKLTPNSLSIILTPGLPTTLAQEVKTQIRNSRKACAVFDDYDIYRLLNSQRSEIEALFEITFEQLHWNETSPYLVQEGQHVRMEMYVGRRDEAERLVRQATFSRIFSGRRLGKTALLKYIEHNFGRFPLPSGNKLKVLYVSIVGLVDERAITEAIELEFQRNFANLEATTRSGQTLDVLIRNFLNAHSSQSLIIFLDEADSFVETEVEKSENSRKQGLSWKMRELEGLKDSRGLARVRFVVCGYRSTDTKQGAWANWGDVLKLKPLEASDAAHLVEGPLSKLGIDASGQADVIAFRCGYQPAIIIRFCKELVESLSKSQPSNDRDHTLVTEDHVAQIFRSSAIEDTIAEVNNLNFIGNPFAELVFAGMLNELKDLPVAAQLTDVPERLAASIGRLVQVADLSKHFNTNWHELVNRELRELVSLELLKQTFPASETPGSSKRPSGPTAFGLRFPHHLLALLKEPIESRIERVFGSATSKPPTYQWLIDSKVLEDARLFRSEEFGIAKVVFGAGWTSPLLEVDDGLGPRLNESHILEVSDVGEVPDGVSVASLSALRNIREQSDEIEILPVGRIQRSAYISWLQKFHGIELTHTLTLEPLFGDFGALPQSLAILTELILNNSGKGATVGIELKGMVADALTSTKNALGTDAREDELIELVVCARSMCTNPRDLLDYLNDAMWPNQDILPLELSDDHRFWTLMCTGILPSNGNVRLGRESLALITENDPLMAVYRS